MNNIGMSGQIPILIQYTQLKQQFQYNYNTNENNQYLYLKLGLQNLKLLKKLGKWDDKKTYCLTTIFFSFLLEKESICWKIVYIA